MLRLLRLRRPPAGSASDSAAALAPDDPGNARASGPGFGSTGSDSGGGATAGTFAPNKRRVQCLLLLHATWVAVLVLMTSGSMLQRRQRSALLARQLLAAAASSAGGQAVAGSAGSLPGTGCVQECAQALQLPQVGAAAGAAAAEAAAAAPPADGWGTCTIVAAMSPVSLLLCCRLRCCFLSRGTCTTRSFGGGGSRPRQGSCQWRHSPRRCAATGTGTAAAAEARQQATSSSGFRCCRPAAPARPWR